MIKIELENLLFNAFHGIHEEEKIIGNDYQVNASVYFHEIEEVIHHINDTVDYAIIYGIIEKRMLVPTPLLETVVMQIGNDIHYQFPDLKSISVSIKKMHPPVERMQGSAEVTWHK